MSVCSVLEYLPLPTQVQMRVKVPSKSAARRASPRAKTLYLTQVDAFLRGYQMVASVSAIPDRRALNTERVCPPSNSMQQPTSWGSRAPKTHRTSRQLRQ